MNKYYKKALLCTQLFVLLLIATPFAIAHAYITPTLSLSNLNNGYNQISVTADSNSAVQLYYYSPNSYYNNSYYNNSNNNIQIVGVIGYTSNSGYFSTTMMNAQYNIPAGTSVFVMVNGIESQIVLWPYYSNYSSNYVNPVSLSQNSLNLTVGQSQSINITGNGSGYYISNNSYNDAVSANITGSTLQLYAKNVGATNITVCQNYGSCATIYVSAASNTVIYPQTYYPTYYYTQPIMNYTAQPYVQHAHRNWWPF